MEWEADGQGVKHPRRPQVQAQLPSPPLLPPASTFRSIQTEPICASYLGPENDIMTPLSWSNNQWGTSTIQRGWDQSFLELVQEMYIWTVQASAQTQARPTTNAITREPSEGSRSQRIKKIQQPTRSRMIHLKARALKQLMNNPPQLKHINPPMTTQQNQLKVIQITRKYSQDK